MNLVVHGKNFEADYERAHTLINRVPGSSYSFQKYKGGFALVFEDGSQEEVDVLTRNGLKASLNRNKDLDFSEEE